MVNLKQTQIYERCRKIYKETKQREYLKSIKKCSINEDDLLSTKDEYFKKVTKYLDNLTVTDRYGFFSDNVDKESIYSYVYYLMLCHLVQYPIPKERMLRIKEILLDAQQEDGFCYDENMINYEYLNGDGWGRRHFIPQYYIALKVAECIPRRHFIYLSVFYNTDFIYKFWSSLNWENAWKSSNVFMNIVCTLQYERDYMGNPNVAEAISVSQKWLLEHIRSDCGMWYQGRIRTKGIRLEIIRAAYHLFPILIYDHVDFPFKEQAIDLIINCQNEYGGFDIRKNSSACEDIDAIEVLIRLSRLCPKYRTKEIRSSIMKAFGWVVQNQMPDGGCVFRLGEDFDYGHPVMTSKANQSNLFATWFRTLSVCYMYNYLSNKDGIKLYRLPGYEYPLDE